MYSMHPHTFKEEEKSVLTFLAFQWGHRVPEPHPPQSLSIHSLA